MYGPWLPSTRISGMLAAIRVIYGELSVRCEKASEAEREAANRNNKMKTETNGVESVHERTVVMTVSRWKGHTVCVLKHMCICFTAE